MLTCFVFSLFYICFVLTGGFVFMLLESNGILFQNEVNELKIKFLSSHPNVSESALNGFVEAILGSKSIKLPSQKDTNSLDWNFGQSVFFATTLVTTIGYGQITPVSTNGKLFSIIYSIIGIPLTLILFTSFSDRLLIKSNSLLNFIVEKYSLQSTNSLKIKLTYLFILLMLLSIFFIFVPAFVFSRIEDDWSYFDSLYYCFISMTTIGLGDYIPGESSQQNFKSIYKLLVSVYLILGLLFTMFVLKTFYEIPELKIMKLLSLRLFEPSQYKNASEYQILFGKEDNTISKSYSQDSEDDTHTLYSKI